MKRFAWKQIIVTFALSFVFGAAFGRWEFSHRMHEQWKDPEARQRWILKRLDAGLDLSAQQEGQVAALLKESAVQMEAVRSQIRPQLDAARQEMRRKMEPLLTAGQLKKYDQMENEWQERKRKYRETLTSDANQPAA